MNGVGRIGRTAAGLPARRTGASGSGFSVPEAAEGPAPLAGTGAAATVGAASWHEAGDDPARRDDAARAGGEAALEALRDLQAALLLDADDPAAAARLAALAHLPPAADPALAGIVRGIAARAAAELALRERRRARGAG